MPVEVTMHEGTIQRYLNAVGDSVNVDDRRYEVEPRGRQRRADGTVPAGRVTREDVERAAKSPRDAPLSLTFDHRVIDGAPALFPQTVIELLNFGER